MPGSYWRVLWPAFTVSSMLSRTIPLSHVTLIAFGYPVAKIPRPRSPPSENLTGIAVPAVALLRAVRSTGEKNPVKGQMIRKLAVAVAGLYSALPAWLALMVQVPMFVTWIVRPVRVQGPVTDTETGRPEEAVAVIAKSGVPRTFLTGTPPMVIVWSSRSTVTPAGPADEAR